MTLYRPNVIQNALTDFDRYFESFFGDTFIAPATRTFSRVPAVDVREKETAYTLDVELPGFEEKDIEILVDGSNLSVASKQEEEKKAQGDEGNWILRERRVNAFSRSFKLPENANPEEVTAVFKNGVLSLEIKKRNEAIKRAISINAT